MAVRKKYPEHANHATKIHHQTIKDVVDDTSIWCPNCRGAGVIVVSGIRPLPNEDKEMACPVCGGEGTII